MFANCVYCWCIVLALYFCVAEPSLDISSLDNAKTTIVGESLLQAGLQGSRVHLMIDGVLEDASPISAASLMAQEQHAVVSAHDVSAPVSIAVAVFAVAMLSLLLLLQPALVHETPAVEVARSVGVYFRCADNVAYALVIPQSYALVRDLGGTIVVSGVMVGVYKLGAALGAALYFAIAQRFPLVWRYRGRLVMATCAMVNVAAMCLYTSIGGIAGRLPGQGVVKLFLIAALITARFFSGASAGVRSQLQRTQIARLTPHAERPSQQVRLILSGVVGLGGGPLLATTVGLGGAYLGGRSGRYEDVGMAGVAVAVSQVFGAACLHSLASAKDELSQDETVTVFDAEEKNRRRHVMFCCFGFSMCCGIITSGLEVASALILEVGMGWPHTYCGLIGLSFLAIIPMRLLSNSYQPSAASSPSLVMRSMIVVALFGTMFRFRVAAPLPGSPNIDLSAGTALLFGDALVAGGMYLSDGLSQGILMQHLLPESVSVLNVSTVNLVLMLSMDGFARFVGPPLARFLIAHGGQNFYAGQQLMAVAFALALVVFGLVPRSERRTPAAAGDWRGAWLKCTSKT